MHVVSSPHHARDDRRPRGPRGARGDCVPGCRRARCPPGRRGRAARRRGRERQSVS